MADKRLAAIGSFLFCGLVVVLLLVLYYPDSSDLEDESNQWTQEINLKSGNTLEYTEAPEQTSKIAAAAKILENMGAGFLAILAVLCVAFGLAFLTCAFCVCR